MSHRILRAADHLRMPWKNGRGETVQIAVHPQGAGLDDFDWRVSMAGVAEDGDFSIFAQVDRSLAVLGGDGIELHLQGRAPHRLTTDSAPLAFPADLACSARLLGRPITDLNVMTRRGSGRHYLGRDHLPNAAWWLLLATQPLSVEFAGQSVALQPLDVLFCDGADAEVPVAAAPGLWQIGIWRG